MSNYAFDRKPYMPTTSSCLVGPRAESISMSCEQWFEVVGYMARPGRVSSFEAEIPKDGRDKVFENLFPGQVYRPIELGDTPSGLPNKLGAQFRINFASLDNCPAVLNDSIRAGNGGCVGRINKSRFVVDLVQFYGFHFGRHQDVATIRKIAEDNGYLEEFEIRKSNIAFGQEGAHRVYIEIPGNWYMVIDIANMLKAIDVPVQTIDFGHPNFRDGKLVKYNEGKPNFWKKEHQVKIFANEFLAVGFNIQHKQEALEKYSEELLEFIDPAKTHKFYWEKPIRRSVKPHHPGENDPYLPEEIRGQHFDSWTDLAKVLGYGE